MSTAPLAAMAASSSGLASLGLNVAACRNESRRATGDVSEYCSSESRRSAEGNEATARERFSGRQLSTTVVRILSRADTPSRAAVTRRSRRRRDSGARWSRGRERFGSPALPWSWALGRKRQWQLWKASDARAAARHGSVGACWSAACWMRSGVVPASSKGMLTL